jgi:YD repeat-containing protein
MLRMLHLASIVVVLALSVGLSSAQVQTGAYNFGTYSTTGPDVINIGNLNVLYNIPILNKAGRGLPLTYNLAYNSSVWYPVTLGSSMTWQPTSTAWGWSGLSPAGQSEITYLKQFNSETCVNNSNTHITYQSWSYSGIQYVDPSGIRHAFSSLITFISGSSSVDGLGGCPANGSTPASPVSLVATDGSGYTATVVPGLGSLSISLVNAKGTRIQAPIVSNPQNQQGTSSLADSNGNEITLSNGQYTDTTGALALSVLGTAPSNTVLSYATTTGSTASYTVSYAQYTVHTAFGCSGVSEYGPTSTSLVNAVTLPDGSSYQFTYEPTPGSSGDVTGRVASVTLPTGGAISYAYTGGSNGIVCADGSTAGLTRTTTATANSPASTWTYARTPGTGTSHTEVVDGLSNHLAYDFVTTVDPPTGVTAAYYETQRKIYQGAETGTPALSRQTCYNAAALPCVTSSTIVPGAEISTYEVFNGSQEHGSTIQYNNSGLPTKVQIYDFGGASSRGPLLRQETWTYSTSIPGLVTQDIVQDGSGTLAGQTLYGYDAATPTASSGVPQHVSVSGPRGNLTSTQYYNSGTTSINTSKSYEDTGSVLAVTTPNGITSYSYDSSFVYNTAITLPTPSSGVALQYTQGYDSTTGLQTSITDPNLAQTTYSYADPLLRSTQITYPNGGSSTYSYTPNQTSFHNYLSSSSYADTENLVDGYGRQSRIAVSNGQSSNPWYQVDTCYDADANVNFQSVEYQGAGLSSAKVCSSSGDSSSYDALGRKTQVTHADGTSINYTYSGRAIRVVDENGVTRISQIDGLGRTTAVCEISANSSMPGSGSPVACGMDIDGTGFLTGYAYNLANHMTTVTQGVQTRVFQNDWLERPIFIQEPERGQTHYSYAYNGTGLVVTRIRPQANQTNLAVTTTTSTQYDSIGRVVSTTYNDGITAGKFFQYDQAINWGSTSLGQSKGQLTYASTNVVWTGMQFTYDPMGRVTFTIQCLPGRCGNANFDVYRSYASINYPQLSPVSRRSVSRVSLLISFRV